MIAGKRKGTQGEAGFTLVEILVGIMILSTTLLSLAAVSGFAARELHASRRDMAWHAAAQTQLESLAAKGFKNATSGSTTLQGFPMTWTVAGTDPKKVTVVIQHVNRAGVTQKDTLLLILSSTDTLP